MEEWSTLCRCCLAAGSTSLLQNDEVQTKFREITSIDVKEDDGLPQQLCRDCLSIMNSAHQFKKQCLRIDTELKMQLAEIGNLVPVQAEEASLPEPQPTIELPVQPESEHVEDPPRIPNVMIKSETPESDDDCYYVLVIDEDNSKDNDVLPMIKEEPKELNPSTGELEFENSVDAFLVKNPQERISNVEQEFEVPLFNDGAAYHFIEDHDTNDSDDHSQLQLTANLDIEDADALLSNHQNGNLIKILTSKGGAENLLFKSENGNEYVTYIVNNQLVSGESDGLSQEGDVIVCEEDAQFEIVNCDGSELVIEYDDDGQISSTIMRQNNGVITCPCGAKFTDYTLFENHQILNHCGDMMSETESHLCSLCGKGFESHEILTGHMLLHTNSSVNINCPYCEQAIKRNSITQHIKYSHNNIKPRCSICDKTFANSNNLKRHMMIHTGVRQFECDVCSKRFHQKITMQTHRLTHLSDPLFCTLCEVHFETEGQLTAHKEQHECENATESLEVSSLQGKKLCYTCNVCSKMFFLESALKYHMDNAHGNEPPMELLCSECGEILPNRKAMYSHAATHQPELGVKMKIERRYECGICRKTCSSQAMLLMHERVHTNERPYPCPLCAQRFKTKTHLRTHQLTHTREKRFGCSVCMKFFALKGNLVVHLRTHTGERPYVCSLCHEAFIDSKYLKKHKMRKHAISNVPWNKY